MGASVGILRLQDTPHLALPDYAVADTLDVLGRHPREDLFERAYDIVVALVKKAKAFAEALVRRHPSSAFDFFPEFGVHAGDYSMGIDSRRCVTRRERRTNNVSYKHCCNSFRVVGGY
jgi:hypothetical protein